MDDCLCLCGQVDFREPDGVKQLVEQGRLPPAERRMRLAFFMFACSSVIYLLSGVRVLTSCIDSAYLSVDEIH